GEVAITYRIKERLREFYDQTNMESARELLDELITTCRKASMPAEVQKLGATLKTWHPQILAYHHAHHSNGITEAMNNLIKRVKRVGYGFRNFNNYRTRVLLYAGKPHWRTLDSITIP
ncbi:MAG: transposase, partial [Ancrocorticia sp.]|nr:transposase [Ancrocorticia sp.]